MIFFKNRNYEFSRKLSFMFFSKIQIIKDVSKKRRNKLVNKSILKY